MFGGEPRWHRPALNFTGDRLGPWPNFLVVLQRHWREHAAGVLRDRSMTALAVLLQDGSDVLVVGDVGCAGGYAKAEKKE